MRSDEGDLLRDRLAVNRPRTEASVERCREHDDRAVAAYVWLVEHGGGAGRAGPRRPKPVVAAGR